MHSHLPFLLIFYFLPLFLLPGFSYAAGLCKHRHIALTTKPSPLAQNKADGDHQLHQLRIGH